MSTQTTVPDYIRVVTKFICQDGKEWDGLESAEYWHQHCLKIDAANTAFKGGCSLYDALIMAGITVNDEHREPLSRITSATELVIGYWQCRDQPGYKVQDISTGRKIYVYGDAGSWSGPYGNYCRAEDLVSYMRETDQYYAQRKAINP